MELISILADIAEGQSTFSASEDSLDSLQEFQSIVKVILSAEESGYLTKVKTQTDFRHPGRLTCIISVRGGLTDIGKRLLKSKI